MIQNRFTTSLVGSSAWWRAPRNCTKHHLEPRSNSCTATAGSTKHTLGWRAQFAYPKNLVLPLHLLPFTLAELNARLHSLTAFGTDILVLRNGETIRLWKHDTGYDANGLDYIISLRHDHYVRQQHERMLKNGDRVALLGQGIAVVQQTDHQVALVVLGNGVSVRIARKNIVLNKQNMRWECEPKSELRG
jgi:preprotein translocase subunit YajC